MENSRTANTNNKLNKVYAKLLEKHLPLYLSNEDNLGKLFSNESVKYYKTKYLKYRTLYRTFFAITFLELLIIIILILKIIF